MNKSALVINTPKSCPECEMGTNYIGCIEKYTICRITGNMFQINPQSKFLPGAR